MTSVATRVEAAVAPEQALHGLPFVDAAPPARTDSDLARVRALPSWSRPALDVMTVCATLALVHLLHESLHPVVLAVLPIAWLTVLSVHGAYQPTHGLKRGGAGVRRVLRAGSTLGLLIWVSTILTSLPQQPGTMLLLTVALTSSTTVVRLAAGSLAAKRERTRVVVAGSYDQVRHVMDELRRAPRRDVEVVSVCLPDEAGQELFDIPVVVGFEAVGPAVETWTAEAVILLPSDQLGPRDLQRLGWQLEAQGTALYLGSGLLDVDTPRTTFENLGSLHLVHVRTAPRLGLSRAVKELWERSLAALLVMLLSPLLVGIALMVRLDSTGPAIFRQSRVGRDGRVFTMLKYRTMTTDAETLAVGLLADNDCDGVLFKLRRDPRVTRVGRVLRRYSLDELPQLLNVLGGRMSLVGPRPALPNEVDSYDHDPRRRLAVKPGLTGLWQVSGRSDLSWEESVRLDLLYVDNWSLRLDLAIVARTAGAVLRARGAY